MRDGVMRAGWRGVVLAALGMAWVLIPSAQARQAQLGPPLPDGPALQPMRAETPVPARVPQPLLDDATPSMLDALGEFSQPGLDGAGAGSTDASSGLNPLRVLSEVGASLPGAGTGRAGAEGRSAGSGVEGRGLSAALNVMVLLTIVSLAPSIMLMCTCFMRILIVLGLLRQALGTQTIPPPQVITALALFMTLLVMSPTLDRIHREAIEPYRAGQISDYDQLWDAGKQPVRDFMFAQIEATGNWNSVYTILEYRGVDTSDPSTLTRADVDMVTLVPAFMLSELKVAFLMGFKVYLPFLVIDMVISTLLIAMGMMMLPPVLISLPFKLLLFVLIDGWTLVVGGLLTSFQQPGAGVGETAMLLHGAGDLAQAHVLTLGAHAWQELAFAARHGVVLITSRGALAPGGPA